MKKFLLTILFLMFSTVAYAGSACEEMMEGEENLKYMKEEHKTSTWCCVCSMYICYC